MTAWVLLRCSNPACKRLNSDFNWVHMETGEIYGCMFCGGLEYTVHHYEHLYKEEKRG